ncbi:MAG: single-stranded DNA-binding protein [Treponema sp.]|nr:single-stranded DNA-binding protein [Treponema sp.]
MNHLNSIILEGNVAKAAELSEPVNGFKVCRFPLAVNRFTKNPKGDSYEEVSFFDVEAYGKMAEICEKNSSKGRGVRVVGRLKQNRWKDPDGKSYSKVLVVAEHVEYKPKPLAAKDFNYEKAEKTPTDTLSSELSDAERQSEEEKADKVPETVTF